MIIGGGPAGCTAAALLAERGRDVFCWRRTRIPASTSANPCCPAISPSSTGWACCEEVRRDGRAQAGRRVRVRPTPAGRSHFPSPTGWTKRYPTMLAGAAGEVRCHAVPPTPRRAAAPERTKRPAVTEIRLRARPGGARPRAGARARWHPSHVRTALRAGRLGPRHVPGRQAAQKQANKHNNTAALYRPLPRRRAARGRAGRLHQRPPGR